MIEPVDPSTARSSQEDVTVIGLQETVHEFDWRLREHVPEIVGEEVERRGFRWRHFTETQRHVPAECRGRFDSECLRRVGQASGADYGVQLFWQNTDPGPCRWRLTIYGLDDGESISSSEGTAPNGSGEARTFLLYRSDVARLMTAI